MVVGQKALLLCSSWNNKLLIAWQGPYEVVEKVGMVTYKLRIPGKDEHLYHINLLKGWNKLEAEAFFAAEADRLG